MEPGAGHCGGLVRAAHFCDSGFWTAHNLTQAVTGNFEERPTTTAVKHMVETAALEVRERCDNALSPLWDAVRILQSGLRDSAGELKAVGASVNNLQQTQVRAEGMHDNDYRGVAVGPFAGSRRSHQRITTGSIS